jgi:surface antigen
MSRLVSCLSLAMLLAVTSCESAEVTARPKKIEPPPLARLAPAAGIKSPASEDLGTLLGAWADKDVSASMTDLDRIRNQQAEKRATNAPAGQVVTWASPVTGNTGTIIAVREAYDNSGAYCREFNQTVTVAGVRKQGRSTACQQADGSWRVASSAI